MGRNFVSDLPTLKPKNLKNFKKTKKTKKPKNLYFMPKNLGFYSLPALVERIRRRVLMMQIR